MAIRQYLGEVAQHCRRHCPRASHPVRTVQACQSPDLSARKVAWTGDSDEAKSARSAPVWLPESDISNAAHVTLIEGIAADLGKLVWS